MMSGGFDTRELSSVAVDLTASAGKAEALAGMAVRKAGLDISARAKSLAPVDTGYLRGSIYFRRDGATEGHVSAGANYAAYLEYGTSRMAARPYMAPAAEAVLPTFQAALEQIAERAL